MNVAQPKIDTILQESKPAGVKDVYVLGYGANQVTVFSQQVRALRLVWALNQQAPLSKQDEQPKHIVVIGGGIGGVTAAAAAMLYGAKVTLLEQGEELLHLQRGCHTRYLHPRIFEWPHPNARRAGADLPIMNWSVGTASDVANRILADYHRIRVTIDKNARIERCGVRNVRPGRDGWTSVFWEEQGRTEFVEKPHAVIVALGFGIEKTIPGLPRRSYWRVDSLDQTALDSEDDPYTILVSGTGDGGITDVLRAQLKNFDHSVFFDECMLRLDCPRLHTKIDDIQARLALFEETLPATPQADKKAGSNQQRPSNEGTPPPQKKQSKWDQVSEFLNEEYAKIGKDEELKSVLANLDDLLSFTRPQTKVIWVGEVPYPISSNSQPLIRLLGWRLVQLGLVKYESGKLDKVEMLDQIEPIGPRYRVTITTPGKAVPRPLDVHQVVVRQGSISALERHFPDIHKAMEGKRSAQVKDGLQKVIKEEYENHLKSLGVIRGGKVWRDDILIRAIPEYYAVRETIPVYRIRIWLEMPSEKERDNDKPWALGHLSWVDYDLHPDEGIVVQRRAMWMVPPKEDSLPKKPPTAHKQFRHWINTQNDFWIRIRCIDGAELGGWLSNTIEPSDESDIPFVNDQGVVENDKKKSRSQCIEDLRTQAKAMNLKRRDDKVAIDWCEYPDEPPGVSVDLLK